MIDKKSSIFSIEYVKMPQVGNARQISFQEGESGFKTPCIYKNPSVLYNQKFAKQKKVSGKGGPPITDIFRDSGF